ncbi:MAG TPA: AMP-binding protein [Sphingomicrobium sp.]|nr:AMP-binding protein [Sphingomicrobium sp.]
MNCDDFVRNRLPPAAQLPEFRFDLPELQYPGRLNAAVELLKGGDSASVSVVTDHKSWSYRDLDDFSGRIGRLLIEQHGLMPGNRVLLRGPNTYTMLAAWLGVLKAGGIVVATMPLLRPSEIETVLERARVSHAIVDSRHIGDFRLASAGSPWLNHLVEYDGDLGRGELENRCALLDPIVAANTTADDPAIIAFTSGTTGVPKGCVHFHRDILAPCDTFAKHLLCPQRGDIFMTSAPMAFTFGLGMGFLFPLRFGAAAATIEQASASTLVDAIVRHGVTHLGTAPTAYKALLSEPRLDQALKTLRTCVSAGEHLPESTWRSWKSRTGMALIDGIGSTEMMHIFISARGEEIRPGSTGRPVPGYSATVLDEDGKPLKQGVGRLAVKGPTGCRYLDDPRQADYVSNGWNVTGDTYRQDADGYFWYVARSDDMIVSSGYNIAAPEVENALLSHAAVRECAVVGAPCTERGQKVKAFVVPAEGFVPDDALVAELQAHAKQKIAPYKYPREIEFVGALPKTATGKLRRSALKTNTDDALSRGSQR